jgi:putative DNA primase/helicase
MNKSINEVIRTVPCQGESFSRFDTEFDSAQERLQTQQFAHKGITDDKENFIHQKELTSEELQRLKQINDSYCQVIVGGKHQVVSTKPCPIEGTRLQFVSLKEFNNNFLHESKIAKKFAGESWVEWSGKNYKPDGLGFYPKLAQCPDSVYNLFPGFAGTSQQGDVTPALTHIEKVLCAGDSKAAHYVLDWLAHIFQKPEEKCTVAILLKSVEGTGKGTLFRFIEPILGQLAVQTNGGYQITGRFNSVMANRLLVFADEVDFTDSRTADKLKGLISEPRVSLERKGIDPVQLPNLVRFIFASNHTNVIRAGTRERRFVVLDPDSQFAQDKFYFDNLYRWIEGDGPNYFYHFLLNRDIRHFDPNRAPVTSALIEEKLASLSPYQAFIYEQLCRDRLFNGEVRLKPADIVQKCRNWCEDNHMPLSTQSINSGIGRLFKQLGIPKQGRSGRNDYYELPNIEDCKRRFAAMLGHLPEQIFD